MSFLKGNAFQDKSHLQFQQIVPYYIKIILSNEITPRLMWSHFDITCCKNPDTLNRYANGIF